MLLIITITGDELLSGIDIDDLEPPKQKNSVHLFCYFWQRCTLQE